jgi:exonuclease SbcC
LSEARKSRSAIEARMGEESKRATSTRARAAEAEDKRLQAESALAKALAQLERDRQRASEADDAAHAARHADMAANLRRGLHAGDACPVCGQSVQKLAPAPPTSDLEKAEATATKARTALDRSIDAHTSAVAEQKGALKAEEERGVQAKEAETQVERTEAEVARAKSEETEIGGELSAILGEGDPEEVLAGRRVEAELRSRAAEDARAKREEARRLHDLAIQAEQQSAKAVAEARSRLTVLAAGLAMESETEGLDVGALASRVRAEWELQSGQAKLRQQQAAATIESARAGVAGILDELGLAPGQFERALAEAKAEAGMLERQVMVAEALVEGSEGDLANQASLIARNDLLGRVASDLTDARFVRFLLDEERRTLAGIGSEHFQLLSSGRYRFTDDGDFMVVDQSSADAIRRADSLSGGETFLASLGLALGLAETVGREGGRLDAFFLDEGFGTLDAEHLDLAMEGIEALVNDRRLVIVVSHLEGVRSRIDDLIVLDRDALTGDSIVRAGAAAG